MKRIGPVLAIAVLFVAACGSPSSPAPAASNLAPAASSVPAGTIQGVINIASMASSPQIFVLWNNSATGQSVLLAKLQAKPERGPGNTWPFSISGATPGSYSVLIVDATTTATQTIWRDASGAPIVFSVPADKGVDIGTIIVAADGTAVGNQFPKQ